MDKGAPPLSDLIREARARKGYGQEEAARRVGVSVRQFGNWERGKHTPGGQYLRSLAHALDLSPDDLAASASGHEPPIDVQATLAREEAAAAAADVATLTAQVAELTAEVERLQRLVRAYEPPSEDQLAAVVDAIVAARLAELAATEGAPEQPGERRRVHRASAS